MLSQYRKGHYVVDNLFFLLFLFDRCLATWKIVTFLWNLVYWKFIRIFKPYKLADICGCKCMLNNMSNFHTSEMFWSTCKFNFLVNISKAGFWTSIVKLKYFTNFIISNSTSFCEQIFQYTFKVSTKLQVMVLLESISFSEILNALNTY